MPAVLGWATEIPTWAQKPSTYYLEAICADRRTGYFRTFRFRHPWDQPSGTDLLPRATIAVVHFAFRIDGG